MCIGLIQIDYHTYINAFGNARSEAIYRPPRKTIMRPLFFAAVLTVGSMMTALVVAASV